MEEQGIKKTEKEANASINKENQNIEIQMEANTSTSSEYKTQSERLAKNIEEVIQKAKDSPHASCRIYKIPNELQQGKNDVYTPKVISIAHLHHGNSRLE